MTKLTHAFRIHFVAAAVHKEMNQARRDVRRMIVAESSERMSDAAMTLYSCEPEWFTFRTHTFEGFDVNLMVRRNEAWSPCEKTLKMLRNQRIKKILIESVLKDLVDRCETLEELSEYISVNKPHLLEIVANCPGLSPTDYAIEKAEEKMRKGDLWLRNMILLASAASVISAIAMVFA
jgi:hypothetical protein